MNLYDFMDQQILWSVQLYLHVSSALRLLRFGDQDFDLAGDTSVAALCCADFGVVQLLWFSFSDDSCT